jgi:hypothetical protein
MGIGRSIAYQYDLPESLPQDQLGGAPIRGGLGQGGQPMATGIPVPEGLQWVDGQTQDIYRRWGDLNQFAKTMKTQFGMDVTDPDYTDPQQVQVSQAYQKAVADLYMNIDKFRGSQKMLQSMVDRGQQLRVDPSEAPIAETIQEAAVRPLEKETELLLADFQKAFDDPTTTELATEKLEEYRGTLENRLAESTNPAEQEMLQRSINAIKGALWDSTRWRQMQTARRTQGKDLTERNEQLRAAADMISQVQSGHPQGVTLLGGWADKKGTQVVNMDSIVTTPDGKVTFKTNDVEYVDENGKRQILEGGDLEFDLQGESLEKYMLNMMRLFDDYDKITFASYRESPYRVGEGGITTGKPAVPETKPQPTPKSEAADELTDIGLRSKTVKSISGIEDEKMYKALATSLNGILKDKKVTLPANIPMREKTVYGAANLNPANVSNGNEKISEVRFDFGGLTFIELKDGEEIRWHIPLSEVGTSQWGDYSDALNNFLERNDIDIRELVPEKYHEKIPVKKDDWSQYEE